MPQLTISNLLRNNLKPIICFLIFLWAIQIRFVRFDFPKPGSDEVHQYGYTMGALKPFWQRADYGEATSFPGDYLLTYLFVQSFAYDDWRVYIPHFMMTVLGFYLLFLLCREYHRTLFGYIITFLIVSLNATMVHHAFHLRPYAVLPTLALASLYLWNRIIVREKQFSGLQVFWMGVFFVLTCGFHAYGLFIVYLPLVYYLLTNRKKARFLLSQYKGLLAAIVFLGFPLWAWYASGNPRQVGPEGFLGGHTHTTFYFIPHPIQNTIGFLKGIFGNLVGDRRCYPFLLGAIVIFYKPLQENWKRIWFLVILIFLPIGAICLLSYLKKYYFLQRQFIWVMPYFALFLGWQWDSMFSCVINKFQRNRQ